jgi:hypothetical protein
VTHSPTLGPTGRVTIAAGVHARKLEGELVILDLAQGDYWALDEIGSRLWDGLTRGQSPTEVAEELRGRYAVEFATLLRDLIALADELVRRRLLIPR